PPQALALASQRLKNFLAVASWLDPSENLDYLAGLVHQKRRAVDTHVLFAHKALEAVDPVLFGHFVFSVCNERIGHTHLGAELVMRLLIIGRYANDFNVCVFELFVVAGKLCSFCCTAGREISWIKVDYGTLFATQV